MKIVFNPIVFMFLIQACSPLAIENSGVDIDVYPVRYEMSIVADQNGKRENNEQWNSFYQRHHKELLNRHVYIKYSNKKGKAIAMEWRNELLKSGATREHITVEHDTALNEADVMIIVNSSKVLTPICNPSEIGWFGKNPVGCANNSNLWQSLSYPEDGLL